MTVVHDLTKDSEYTVELSTNSRSAFPIYIMERFKVPDSTKKSGFRIAELRVSFGNTADAWTAARELRAAGRILTSDYFILVNKADNFNTTIKHGKDGAWSMKVN